jgi:hypothetical protein
VIKIAHVKNALFSLKINVYLLIVLFHVGIEVLTMVIIKSTIFWDIRQCRNPEDGGDICLRIIG